MFTKHFTIFTLIFSGFLATSLLQVETATFKYAGDYDLNPYPIVYRRFIRRRPPLYQNDKYMEEIVEIFDTKEKPTAYGDLMSDKDVDEFIYCDLNRHLDICKQYWQSRHQQRNFHTRQTPPTTMKPVITTSYTTVPAILVEITTENSKIPDLKEDDYIYSDETQVIEDKQTESTNYEDYYAEEIDV